MITYLFAAAFVRLARDIEHNATTLPHWLQMLVIRRLMSELSPSSACFTCTGFQYIAIQAT